MNQNLSEIAYLFNIKGVPIKAEPLGKGLINDTYLITTSPENAPDYVLQRINHNVFQNVNLLQNNIEKVTNHIRHCLEDNNETDIDRKTLTLVETKLGNLFVKVGSDYWRMTVNIPEANTYDKIDTQMAELTGKAFGNFHTYLSRPDTPRLEETIPDFHNTSFRINQLKDAIAKDSAGRFHSVAYIARNLLDREEEMTLPFRLNADGTLPKRITHCDTKVDNILFDSDRKPLCVIDLDTTMPGFVLSDFGDFLRTAANTGKEDDPDLSRVGINLEIFKAFSRGYLSTAKFLTPLEKKLLPFGAKMLTYMQAVRFLTDYLNGDTYFKISHPTHNLQRTRAQLKLLEDIDNHFPEMENYIASL